MEKGLKLTDILVTIIIALIFGIIYKLWGPLYGVISTLGLHVEQLIYGMWFIAAVVAYLIIRKPGVALLAEVAAAQGEFIFGGEWGVATLIFGLGQGLAAELIFAAFRYQRFDMIVASLAGVASALASLGIDFYYGYIGDLALWNLLILFGTRIAGGILISGIFAHLLVKALEKTGVTNLVRPASQEDYKALG
ncbi:energy-coupling factor transport system substrate-specific component [Halobacillus karajensis]|uniref:HMP/thiamine permease protein YkoE n=1 Tax=Halobacillus karajensis TaxID=195088 RepID=A0A024P853_9BACI|nr:ECF transporter S component [Halobacillus karajensis]CDQ20068.1 Putative HMP/thiamine permease protein YkoE [Halobacillus karajensis]CDQ25269.1 Putative HMP/thiamine permease protein YkoE [Halobacillus karajensis]CDQ28370.1 Putative HMP/thiamine permease protein YkoE [Halobacillus karajensis]SEI00148.1 energy-coupling factor transport system substrate-specific component [Halobacillus karajensis]